jgi:hypothetical protein
VLFSGGQDKDGMCRGFFQCFQKSIEGRGTEHVHLINDIDLVFTGLWRKPDLFYKFPDIVYRVVTRRVKFMHIEGVPVVERQAGAAFVARLTVLPQVFTVYGFRKNPCAGCFAYTPWAAKQECMCQVMLLDGVFQCGGYMGLPHYRRKMLRSVFSG